MERLPCENQDTCALAQTPRGCFEDIHHKEWPKRDYVTSLEKEYRELDINKILGCRALHNELHATTPPPEKPSHADMRAAVNGHRVITLLDEGGLI